MYISMTSVHVYMPAVKLYKLGCICQVYICIFWVVSCLCSVPRCIYVVSVSISAGCDCIYRAYMCICVYVKCLYVYIPARSFINWVTSAKLCVFICQAYSYMC